MMRPIQIPALKSLKGFAFSRSRSAPPIPREEKPAVQDGAEIARPSFENIEDGTSTLRGTFNEKDVIDEVSVADTIQQTTTYPEPSSRIDPTLHTPQPFQIRAPIPVSAIASSPTPLSLTALAAVSRSSSPAPSVEKVIMVERKRRATSGSASMPAPKGPWFKSSPLNGERSGIVIAERVRRIPPIGDLVTRSDSHTK